MTDLERELRKIIERPYDSNRDPLWESSDRIREIEALLRSTSEARTASPIEIDISARFTFEELAAVMSPKQIRAFLEGIGQTAGAGEA